MKIDAADAYSIMGVANNAILSKTGSITICFSVENPEPYTLDINALHHRHQELERAWRTLPDGAMVHKQDVFLKRKYDPSEHMKGKTYLERSDMRHFRDRLYMEHHCILGFVCPHLDSFAAAYVQNPLAYRKHLTHKDGATLRDFLVRVQEAVYIIRNLPDTHVRSLEEGELKQYLFMYTNGFTDAGIQDISFAEKTFIGESQAYLFCITDENYLPQQLPVCVTDDTLPISNSNLHMALLEKIGVHLPYNHCYNQIIYCEGHSKLKQDLKRRVIHFGQHRKVDKEVEQTYHRLDEMQTEVINTQVMLCRAHFSLMVWDQEPAELEKAKDKVREVLKMRDFQYYDPKFEWFKHIFLGTVLGCCNKLDPSLFFLTDTGVANTLFINYSVFRDDPAGALFCDRIFQKPLRKDIWDEGKKRISARNALMFSATGGGKSATTASLIESDIIDGTIPIVVEFGKSFLNLSRVYADIAIHIDYDGVRPLGINPFYIKDKSELTPEKIKSLTVMVLKFWREKVIRESTLQAVSLTKIIKDYYSHVESGHSFQGFYLFLKDSYAEIIERQQIPAEYFNLESFLHICSEFMPGGIYESVCCPSAAKGDYEDIIRNKQLVIFELTQVKKDPFLVSVLLAVIIDTVENKILVDRSKRGKLYLDEYGETSAIKDNFTGEHVHSTVAYYFQKFRKENAAIYAILQTPDQLPPSPDTDGILANTPLIYVLPTNEKVYASVIAACHIKNPTHINLMKSIKNNFSGPRPYAEVFIRFGEQHATVVRLEFSREKLAVFQTDGPDWSFLEKAYALSGSMEQAVNQLIEYKYPANDKVYI